MKETPNSRSIATIAAIVFFVATGVLFGILSMQLRLTQGDLAKPPHYLLQFGILVFTFCVSIPNALSKMVEKVGKAYLIVCVFVGCFGVLGLYWEFSDTAPPSLNDGLPMALANTFIGIVAITLLSRGKNAFAGGLCPRICGVSILLYAGMTSWVIHQDRLLNARSEWLYWPSEIFLTMLAGLGIYMLIKGTKAYEKWMPGNQYKDFQQRQQTKLVKELSVTTENDKIHQNTHNPLKSVLLICLIASIPVFATTAYVVSMINSVNQPENETLWLELKNDKEGQSKRLVEIGRNVIDVSIKDRVLHVEYADGTSKYIPLEPAKPSNPEQGDRAKGQGNSNDI